MTLNVTRRSAWVAAALVAALLALSGCGGTVSQTPAGPAAQTAPANAVAAAPDETPEQQETSSPATPSARPQGAVPASEQESQYVPPTASERARLEEDAHFRTMAAVGLYHLYATVAPGFRWESVDLEKFNALLDTHGVDLGYLMTSSFDLARELRECLDVGAMVHQEVVYMIADAVQGELEEAYPNLLPDVRSEIGVPRDLTPSDIAEGYANRFLNEISLEGGHCTQLEADLPEIDCTVFRVYPEI